MNELTEIIINNDSEKLKCYVQQYGDELNKHYSHINKYNETDPLIHGLKLNNETFYLLIYFLGLTPDTIIFDHDPNFREIDLFQVAIIQGNMDFLTAGFSNGQLSLSAINLSLCAFHQPLSFTQLFYTIGSQSEDIKITENAFIRNMLLEMTCQFNKKHAYSKDLADNFFFFKDYFKEEINDKYILSALFSMNDDMNALLKLPADLRNTFFKETMNISIHECFMLISFNAKFKENNHQAMFDIFTTGEIKQIYTHFFTSLSDMDDYKIQDNLECFCSTFCQQMLNNNQDMQRFLCVDNPFFDMRFFDENYLSSCRRNKSLSAHYQKVKIHYDLKKDMPELPNKNTINRL